MGPARTRDFDVVVMTSAALPWRTGPAYLSLHRAAALRALGLRVAYVAPWAPPRAQAWLWGGDPCFATPADHAAWLAVEAEAMTGGPAPTMLHYRGHASRRLRSIVPLQDVFGVAPSTHAIILDEPEHLCWFPRTRPRRAVPAQAVLGVVMTNYDYYIRHAGVPGAAWLARRVTRVHRHLLRAHVDIVIPLSPAVADMTDDHPGRIEVQATGVRSIFADVPPVTQDTMGVYFLGRLVWDKGLRSVIDIAQRTGLHIDILGDGPDSSAIRAYAQEQGAPVRFLGSSAAPWAEMHRYRVFLNPSRSEVLCTATAEALVAGRHVVMADCPANAPFAAYPNAHLFTDLEGAIAALRHALEAPPAPPDAVRNAFDWGRVSARLAALAGLNGAPPADHHELLPSRHDAG